MCVFCFHHFLLFFFKQKTAYEMRISDWSSDVCSSDLLMSEIDGLSPWGGTALARSIERAGNVVSNDVESVIVVVSDGEERSEERRVGKECVSTCRSRW